MDGNKPYMLLGPQNEVNSAWWLENPKIGVVPLDTLRKRFTPDPYPTKGLKQGTELLEALSKQRNQTLPKNYLSAFINLQPAPFGAIINTTRKSYKISDVNRQRKRLFLEDADRQFVRTGRELARMFEIETPGIQHRHALNWLLYHRPDISPVRQARIWLALDLAIYSALSAAWYYKWADPVTRFRPRPIEVDGKLSVEADRIVGDDGNSDGPPRTCPVPPSRGTPRHPAYPSGHSTYSTAASRVLKYFFCDPVPPPRSLEVKDDEADNWPSAIDPNSTPSEVPEPGPVNGSYNQAFIAHQLDKLADNIGWARLWHNVHWGSDHTFGQKLGEAVADCVIEQFEKDCIVPFDPRPCSVHPDDEPPKHNYISDLKAIRTRSKCDGKGRRHDYIEPKEPNTAEIGTLHGTEEEPGIAGGGTY
ncbi:vanadium-dependent haloperoxidase [Teichococcus vastitatis]|uniref:Vanadium-dependent haloperoxidase n=1 Tax=Teichococcus vastitatis TaxID=2307076 RepID=A0ABS9WBI4_9PROT|nr:vanadium-dependent haloperoxidase [Pseudoroseomonas vastitatis]MCI0756672.1 vanadium-dependent haloperoxidase [Pseudoroseomonas vastitatis]